ncbi:MAG: hypothetical protein ACQEXJ_12000 [Myxococcota bacterium]
MAGRRSGAGPIPAWGLFGLALVALAACGGSPDGGEAPGSAAGDTDEAEEPADAPDAPDPDDVPDADSGDAAADAGPEAPAEIPAVLQAVDAAYAGRSVPADERIWALHRYPRALQAGEAVTDRAGEVLVQAPAPAVLYWADLHPYARWAHDTLLILVDPDTREILQTADASWWPVVGGEESAWGVDTPEVAADDTLVRVRPRDVVRWEAPPVRGAGAGPETRRDAPEDRDGEAACVPTRHALLVVAEASGHDTTADRALAEALLASPGIGVDPADVHAVGSAMADVAAAATGLDVACCDEVILYFAGLGGPGPALAPGDDPILPGALADLVAEGEAARWLVLLDAPFGGDFATALPERLGRDHPEADGSHAVHVFSGGGPGEPVHTASVEAGDGQTAVGGAFTQVVLRRLLVESEARDAPWPMAEDAGGEDTLLGRLRAAMPEGGTLEGRIADGPFLVPAPALEGVWPGGADAGMRLAQRPHEQANDGYGDACECAADADCAQPDDPCRASLCVAGRCQEEAIPIGAPCDDGDPCTRDEVCTQDGACTPAVSDACDDGDPCTVDTCDPASGACAHSPAAAGTPCDDGQACTTGDACDGAGTCEGTATDCDDGNPCTADACDPASGACEHPPAEDGTGCDDGVACTTASECQQGACVATNMLHSACEFALDAAAWPCTASTCTPDGCVWEQEAEGCAREGVPGTCEPTGQTPGSGTGEVWQCVPDAPHCSPETAASDCADFANGVFGVKQSPQPHPDCAEIACADSACTLVVEEQGMPCDVGDPCSEYACDGAGGCDVVGPTEPAPEGCACDPAGVVEEECASLVDALADRAPCVGFECADGGSDGEGVCRPVAASGPCTPDGDACWEGGCTKHLECLPRAGLSADLDATPSLCDDGVPCTADACVGPEHPEADGVGCVHPCMAGVACPQDPAATCMETAASCACLGEDDLCQSSADCDDGEPCTDDDCEDGLCFHPPTECDDGEPCTDDFCEAGAGCATTPADCDDGDPCTDDSCAPGMGCVHALACPATWHWTPEGVAVAADGTGRVEPDEQDQVLYDGDGAPAGTLGFRFVQNATADAGIFRETAGAEEDVPVLSMTADAEVPVAVLAGPPFAATSVPTPCIVGVTVRIHWDPATEGYVGAVGQGLPLVVAPLGPDDNPVEEWMQSYTAMPPDPPGEGQDVLEYAPEGLETACPDLTGLAIFMAPTGGGDAPFLWLESLAVEVVPAP